MKKDNKRVLIGGTIGMMAYHHNMRHSLLVRVHFHEENDKIILVPVNGHNLSVIRCIKQVEISIEEYNGRPTDPYDSCTEFYWALGKLGFELLEEEDE